MSRKQTPESFWKRINKGKLEDCWDWLGSCNNTGYGTVAWDKKMYTAHRVSAWLSGLVEAPHAPKNSRVPTHVLHVCDNRKCCNPNHFFLGSFSDNQQDAYNKKRKVQPKGENHTNAKLTNNEAMIIRQRYIDGESQTIIAKKYNVSQRAISLIVRGVTYK